MKSLDGYEMMECPVVDRDHIELDSSGFYFLIRLNFRHGIIEVAVCKRQDRLIPPKGFAPIEQVFYGRCAQDIYHEILTNKPYVTSLTHAAYLGKELKKAEMALALGAKEFYQE